MNIVFVGDVFGSGGRKALTLGLKKIREAHKINFLVVNGENITHGRGMNKEHYLFLTGENANVITMGNHTFSHPKINEFLNDAKNIVVPYNYQNAFGKKVCLVKYNDLTICVFQVLGTAFMKDVVDNPFFSGEEVLEKYKADIYICDFHGETASEKMAFANYFDGKIDIVFGTHTHVPTLDLKFLPLGTCYRSDVGMTGPVDSVIGVKKEIIIDRLRNDGRKRFEPETTGPMMFNACLVEYSEKLKKIVDAKIIHYEF